jgi:hypothetical protein
MNRTDLVVRTYITVSAATVTLSALTLARRVEVALGELR